MFLGIYVKPLGIPNCTKFLGILGIAMLMWQGRSHTLPRWNLINISVQAILGDPGADRGAPSFPLAQVPRLPHDRPLGLRGWVRAWFTFFLFHERQNPDVEVTLFPQCLPTKSTDYYDRRSEWLIIIPVTSATSYSVGSNPCTIVSFHSQIHSPTHTLPLPVGYLFDSNKSFYLPKHAHLHWPPYVERIITQSVLGPALLHFTGSQQWSFSAWLQEIWRLLHAWSPYYSESVM